MNSQQQQTHLDNAVSVKVTFSKTQENRFVALASPASFAQLVDKACLAFNVDQATRTALHVHYIDDEGDRISVSSDDELACALLLTAPGRLLRLFVDTTPANIAPIIAAAPVKQEDASEASRIAAKTDQEEDEEQQACCAQQTTGVAALMLKLGITDIPEKRCARVLARFNGDMDKAAEVLQRCHERKQLRATKQQQQQQQKPDEEPNQREARAEQRQARRNERLAARLARQQSRSQGGDEADNAPAEVDALVAFMADKGLPTGRGKCVAALRRSGGDVEAAKAALLAWSTKQEQRRQQKAAGTTIEEAFAPQLAKLQEMGFGDDGSGRPNAAERLRRRNLRLLAKFGGDVEQVAQHLTARKAQNQARMAERKERREQPVPSELVPLLAKLDEKGLGAEEGCDNAERIRKRNLRLLKKLDGDVERVASIIEARQARKQARLARRAATSAC